MNKESPYFDDLNFGGFDENPEYYQNPQATYRPVAGKEVLSTVKFTESCQSIRLGHTPTLQREMTQA